jgi:hypothetical protein
LKGHSDCTAAASKQLSKIEHHVNRQARWWCA